jgi:predicted MPP superfamily phosphohydrolase
MNGWRFAIFLTIVLCVWAMMHAYVFWRVAGVPWVAAHVSRRTLIMLGLLLWASYPLARMLAAKKLLWWAVPVEWVAANWIGVLFLLFAALLAVDMVTLGGWFLPSLRGWALSVALALSVVALIQGLRPPIVRDYEVQLQGLPRERDGLRVIAISDVHLGSLIGARWLTRLVERVNELRPDLILMVGDVVDGEAEQVEQLVPILRRFRAPLGVWAVTGNHEYYAGLDHSLRLFDNAGFGVLRDRWVEPAPGVIVAGVDDLTARRQFAIRDDPLTKALAKRPSGATILLSHSPWQAERAAAAGVGLMLAGHTHNGQIWPFNYLVGLAYRLTGGRYDVGGLPVVVCRGTGTWGPRMRLWYPSEFLHITLRAAPVTSGSLPKDSGL